MKDKRKEILKDLLGEFVSEDEGADEGFVEEEVVEEDHPSPPEEDEPIIPEEDDDEKFSLDNLLTEPKRSSRPKAKKKVKKTSKTFQAEIIEEGLVPSYNVSVPHFSDKETLIFNEVREKLVEVAVSQGEEFNIDGDQFIGEVKQFLRGRGVRDVEDWLLKFRRSCWVMGN